VQQAAVYVAIYRPAQTGSARHWAIYIRNEHGQSTLHQVENDFNSGAFRVARRRVDVRPEDSRSWIRDVGIGRVNVAHLQAIRNIIQGQPVNNESETWNCQTWVIEVLERLEQEGYLTISRPVRTELQRLRETY
jgi:hypothetical protein